MPFTAPGGIKTFGQRRSKGCVNMTNYDAQWFYEFASLGTPVHVRN